MKKLLICSATMFLSACGSGEESSVSQNTSVASSGKVALDPKQVPPEVLQVALVAEPKLEVTEAETETRDGRRYFDVGGTLPDGSEIEFDIMEEKGRWRVVETQRDIAFSAAPAAVREASAVHDKSFAPTRVIESKQQDGLTIYELYGPERGNAQGRKVELKWDGRQAEVLTKEWAH
jgi:hypothetical protein